MLFLKRNKFNFTSPGTKIESINESPQIQSRISLKKINAADDAEISHLPHSSSINNSGKFIMKKKKTHVIDPNKRENLKKMIRKTLENKMYVNIDEFEYQISKNIDKTKLQSVNKKFQENFIINDPHQRSSFIRTSECRTRKKEETPTKQSLKTLKSLNKPFQPKNNKMLENSNSCEILDYKDSSNNKLMIKSKLATYE